ncbi:exodeoxyribonuclease 7 large subunit [bacterium BMS3Bbin11]|nr:exodeoxyribonuclease 7 large subunit [bacterium BMS3Abin11]GBE46362.1 exodeoxyribonuclease 7 large subunit [bacterium BMS3Bbin11]GMT39409.1 MAG: exodeoxyribonuclease 7 large subunit [bacterium]HDH16957.1 exodeoxyribonuclease VII large subunit [Gammaproteobacteria bacterium]HDZ78481.1 exodeoxyribonuclease VII large subunit [Gammaproteobacteria bacterium]
MHTGKTIYTVSLLTKEVKRLLEASYTNIQVEGEISGLTRPASGHQYFNLKDENAQLRCVFFKNSARLSPVNLANGMHVILSARVSLYEQRGDFQLIVQAAVDAGEGLLRKKFEQLKARLGAEGLFELTTKNTLPSLPNRVGIITSATGAAIHDIISVFKRRYPAIQLLIYPSMVQGELAAESLVTAINTANTRRECDVLILARGGGSLEDLWPFNEEIVARAIYHCKIPLVSAVGHESDFTISDLVADIRTATPTAAAEMLSPDLEQLSKVYTSLHTRLTNALNRHHEAANQQFDHLHLRLNVFKQQTDRAGYRYSILSKRFSRLSAPLIKERQHQLIALATRIHRPDSSLGQYSQHRLNLELRLDRAIKSHISSSLFSYISQNKRLSHHLPENIVQHKSIYHGAVSKRLWAKIPELLQHRRSQLESKVFALQALSPLQTLARGFATLQILGEQKIVSSVNQVKVGDELQANLQDGYIHCKINKVQRAIYD